MALVHKVEIVWDELMDAFTSGTRDRVYFLDRITGAIFFVSSSSGEDDVLQTLENNQERFVEIPRFDFGTERRVLSEFLMDVQDRELKKILSDVMTYKRTYGSLPEIMSFFPEEEERLVVFKDEFFAGRVKNWLEENNLITVAPGTEFLPYL